MTEIAIEKTTRSRLPDQDINNAPFGEIFSDHIFTATYTQGQWQDLKITPYQKLALSPATSALHYGQSVFEGLKAYRSSQGNPLLFRPEANWQRMNQSAHRLCMPSLPSEIFLEGLKALIHLDADWVPTQSGSVLYIRPLYFATDEFVGLRPAINYQFVILTCPVGAYYPAPVKLIAIDQYVRAFPGGTGAAKCAGNYAGSLLAQQEAKQKGYDNVIWLDGIEKKYIEECGTMNIAFVINDKVVTPKLTGTILAGITRDSVLTMFRDLGMPVEERLIAIDELVQAYDQGELTEAFGMGTAATIAHISQIHYQGRDLNLPPVSERKYANLVFEKLEAIKTGTVPDPYGWVVPI